MTPVEAQKIIASLVAVFPEKMAKLQPEQQKLTEGVYRRMVADLDYDATNAAVARLIATQKFMPAPAEIREAVLALTSGEQRAGGEAWGDVLAMVRRHGSYRTPGVDFEFVDPAVAECVASLGWQNLCLSENQVADRARFVELYEHVGTRRRQLALSEGLAAVQKFRALNERKATPARAVSAGDAAANVLRLVQGERAPS